MASNIEGPYSANRGIVTKRAISPFSRSPVLHKRHGPAWQAKQRAHSRHRSQEQEQDHQSTHQDRLSENQSQPRHKDHDNYHPNDQDHLGGQEPRHRPHDPQKGVHKGFHSDEPNKGDDGHDEVKAPGQRHRSHPGHEHDDKKDGKEVESGKDRDDGKDGQHHDSKDDHHGGEDGHRHSKDGRGDGKEGRHSNKDGQDDGKKDHGNKDGKDDRKEDQHGGEKGHHGDKEDHDSEERQRDHDSEEEQHGSDEDDQDEGDDQDEPEDDEGNEEGEDSEEDGNDDDAEDSEPDQHQEDDNDSSVHKGIDGSNKGASNSPSSPTGTNAAKPLAPHGTKPSASISSIFSGPGSNLPNGGHNPPSPSSDSSSSSSKAVVNAPAGDHKKDHSGLNILAYTLVPAAVVIGLVYGVVAYRRRNTRRRNLRQQLQEDTDDIAVLGGSGSGNDDATSTISPVSYRPPAPFTSEVDVTTEGLDRYNDPDIVTGDTSQHLIAAPKRGDAHKDVYDQYTHVCESQMMGKKCTNHSISCFVALNHGNGGLHATAPAREPSFSNSGTSPLQLPPPPPLQQASAGTSGTSLSTSPPTTTS
ncbi:hypothetical protein B0O80DRAFT_504059 [Mortierella sp. GBAus27b]|nr:hypothetical protein BGX31_009785 [Mortierella sp. GBA43]KAI8345792.1 hypothetical protein B0O80DRAFT_504059 [Mortierella sp. GBAus27b]